MDWPKLIVFVRHGESEGNARKGHQGSWENKANHSFLLTPKGRQQATLTGEYLKERYGIFDAYFCSTFNRTSETLSIISPEAKPVIDSRLNERWRGIWHNMTDQQAAELYPTEAHIKEREGEYHYRAFGGQNGPDVELAIHSFLQSLRMDYSGKRVLVVTHGNWMLFLWRIMLNLHPSEFITRYHTNKYHNCALAVYEKTENGILLTCDNKICYSQNPG